jgi:hypothetical protein
MMGNEYGRKRLGDRSRRGVKKRKKWCDGRIYERYDSFSRDHEVYLRMR